MADPYTVALISASSLLLGVVVTQSFELLKRKSEEKRWYADYFLPKKYDSISNFYACLQNTYGTLSVYHTRKLSGPDELQSTVVKSVNDLTQLHHMASIYLSSETNKLIHAHLKLTAEAGLYISSKVEPIIYNDNGVDKVVVVDWPEDQYNLFKCKKGSRRCTNPKIFRETRKEVAIDRMNLCK